MKPVYYAEVPEAKVSALVVAAAHAMRAFVETDLGLPPLTIRWFTERPIEERPPLDELGRLPKDLLFLNADCRSGIHGRSFGTTLWLRRVGHPLAAAIVTAHEARHSWQSANWDPRERTLDEREDDAHAYELDAVNRWQPPVELPHSRGLWI